ncbi:MAG: GGDEF domain-containing protein [bacterium]|nr:GGDEF domain-containing protein [bacterium]
MRFKEQEGKFAPGTQPEHHSSDGVERSTFETLGRLLESGGDITTAMLGSALKDGLEKKTGGINYEQFIVLMQERDKKRDQKKDQEIGKLQKQLEDADVDGLTSLFTRKRMNSDMPKKILELHRSTEQKGLLFLMFDIDYFKQINDTYGHQVGDEVLTMVGHRLRGMGHRGGDSAYRYGGEELALVLVMDKGMSEEEVQNIIKLKRDELNNTLSISIKKEDGTEEKIPVVLSVGGGYFLKEADKTIKPEDRERVVAEAVEKVIGRADKELYADKKSKGKRRVDAEEALKRFQ